MQKNKRLRVFAGPNGSGKSTLFNEFKNNYNPGYFINPDELEKLLRSFFCGSFYTMVVV